MEVANRIKLFSALSKIIGNLDLLNENFDFLITQHDPGEIRGNFKITGELAKDLEGFLNGQRQRENPTTPA